VKANRIGILAASLASAALILPLQSRAQVSVGILGGLGSTSLSGTAPDDATYTGERSFTFGLTTALTIGEGLALILQPQYVGRGSGVAYAVKGEDEPRDSLTLSMAYISIPFGLSVTSASGRFFVTSLLDYSRIVSADFDDGSGAVDIQELLPESDFGVSLGVGTRIDVGHPILEVELRYSRGLRNLAGGGVALPEAFPPRLRVTGVRVIAGLQFVVGGGS